MYGRIIVWIYLIVAKCKWFYFIKVLSLAPEESVRGLSFSQIIFGLNTLYLECRQK